MSKTVLHLITGLETGGAETALAGLLRSMQEQDRHGLAHHVVSLIPPSYMGREIQRLGIPVSHLGMQRGMPSPAALLRLVSLVREHRPAVLQTWLYHADLMGLAGSWLTFGIAIPVVWNLRCAFMDFSQYPRTTAWTVNVLARLSRFPAAVIANSAAALEHHRNLGYRPRHTEVIPNGVDTVRYAPDPAAGSRLRAEFGLPEGAVIAGLAARFDPMKDIRSALFALGQTAGDADLHLLLCGQDMDQTNGQLAKWIREAGVAGRVHLAGHRPDLDSILPGMDIYLSSSIGESFPNSIAEAMACQLPVVATDAGASRELVAPKSAPSAGRIVPVGDVSALGQALQELAAMPPAKRASLGQVARKRVAEEYSWTACADRYAALYHQLA